MVNVNLKMKPDWFLERHPFGLVRVLEKNDSVVFESSVCNDYLDEVYPERPLYPRDPVEKTRHKMAMAMFERVRFVQYLFIFFSRLLYHRVLIGVG